MMITGSSDIAPHGHRCRVQGVEGGSQGEKERERREGDARSPDVVLCGNSNIGHSINN